MQKKQKKQKQKQPFSINPAKKASFFLLGYQSRLSIAINREGETRSSIRYTENKIAKNLGLLYKTLFRQKCLTGYLLFVFIYLHQQN